MLDAEEFLLAYQKEFPRLLAETSTKEDMEVFYSSAQGAQVTIDVMIAFAKKHLESYKKSVKETIDKYVHSSCNDHTPYWGPCGSCGRTDEWDVIDDVDDFKQSIEELYPLEEVK